jgi:Asp/Glu/hydantoin racemase
MPTPNKQDGFLGILMLDTQFPRILGDAGNTDSFAYPARTKIVTGAGSLEIVKDGKPSATLIEAFCQAAKSLEDDGAKAIISTCGFLITIQDIISDAVTIPVMVSGLSLYPKIKQEYARSKIGILTASSKNLGSTALIAAEISSSDVIIEGFQDCAAFTSVILQDKSKQPDHIDAKAIEKAAVQKACNMLARQPDIGAILLECGNLPPYAKAIKQATGLPVFSIIDGANLLMHDV